MSVILKFSNETHICACIHLLCIMGIYEYICIYIIIKIPERSEKCYEKDRKKEAFKILTD